MSPGSKVVVDVEGEGEEAKFTFRGEPKPVAVPSVIGLSYDSAAAQLQSAGFTVGRADVDSDQPAEALKFR